MPAEPFLSRFALAHHNSWRGPLGGSQFPQPHLEDGSVYRQNRATREGSNRSSGTRWHTHLWVCFTYTAASKSAAHEDLSFPLVLRRTHEGLLKGGFGLTGLVQHHSDLALSARGRQTAALGLVHVLPCSVLASTPHHFWGLFQRV